MSAPAVSQSIEQARALIARHKTAEARSLLAPLRGIAAIAGPIEMLVGYSYIIDTNIAEALTALRQVPAHVEAGIGLAVGRLLLSCDAGTLALERFRRILVQHPTVGDAAVSTAEAASLAGHAKAALAWASRATVFAPVSTGLFGAKLQALIDLGQTQDAATLVKEMEQSGTDVEAVVSTVTRRFLGMDGRTTDVDRLMSALDDTTLRRPKVATVAAVAAYISGSPERASELLTAAGWSDPAGVSLRHEIALELGDTDTAARAHAQAQLRVLHQPGDCDATLGLLEFWLRTTVHDAATVLRWASCGAVLAGQALAAGPDRLFDECVRWKNDESKRVNGRSGKLAHALGALAAEATFGSPIAVRNGTAHARITIAGRDLKLRLTSNHIRRSTGVLFAMEPGMYRWFAGFDPSDVLVDVGANIGMYSVLAAGISGCRVIAIEPFSLNVADLQHNVAVNGLEHRITVMHAAATDRERVDRLYFGQSFAGAANQSFGRDDISEQYDDRDANSEEVRGIPLDTLVARGEIPFPAHVKIDVDGFEEQVIEGMRGILSDPRFKSLRMEIRWLEESREPFIDTILAQGFSVKVADDVKNLLFTRLPPG
ncbi:Methyltransferase FkbM [alpha proteobacterium BAL199]|nr:Methyltransferase FkbM [alpha proteobacterium BAL199]